MTSILYLHQIAPGQATIETCLTSARQELQALITICESSDTQKTVAYLHWLVPAPEFERACTDQC